MGNYKLYKYRVFCLTVLFCLLNELLDISSETNQDSSFQARSFIHQNIPIVVVSFDVFDDDVALPRIKTRGMAMTAVTRPAPTTLPKTINKIFLVVISDLGIENPTVGNSILGESETYFVGFIAGADRRLKMVWSA